MKIFQGLLGIMKTWTNIGISIVANWVWLYLPDIYYLKTIINHIYFCIF